MEIAKARLSIGGLTPGMPIEKIPSKGEYTHHVRPDQSVVYQRGGISLTTNFMLSDLLIVEAIEGIELIADEQVVVASGNNREDVTSKLGQPDVDLSPLPRTFMCYHKLGLDGFRVEVQVDGGIVSKVSLLHEVYSRDFDGQPFAD